MNSTPLRRFSESEKQKMKEELEATRTQDLDKLRVIIHRADEIAKVIGVDDMAIDIDTDGVVLTPDQLDLLWTELTNTGYRNAISVLRTAGERASAEGDSAKWARLVAVAEYLEGLM